MKIEVFEVGPDYIKLNGDIIFKGPAILSWPPLVFHRIKSPKGSISTNYAYHYPKFSRESNFNIYQLNTKNGDYKIVRKATLDEK